MSQVTQLRAEQIEEEDVSQVLQQLTSSREGLTDAQATERLKEFGANALEEHKENLLLQFLSYFWGPIPWMIEIAAILSVAIGHWLDFIIVMSLLVLNGIIGFWEEHKAQDALAALKSQLAPIARVLRASEWKQIEATQLVPGDIVRLRPGDIIPADVMLMDGDYLSVDQSALTGESLPVSKSINDTAYSGTIVKQGEMTTVVIATGTDTYFGRTAQLVAGAGATSHFQKAVMQIGNFLIFIAVGLSVLLVATELVRGEPFLQLVQFVLILVVASIPVAMPAVLSVTMALGALALSKMKAIVTRLQSIEEMAGIDILCSDKTGTLTQNKLTLSEGVCFGAKDERHLLLDAALASRAENHDPIDQAIIGGLRERGGSTSSYRQTQFTPFDPVSKRTEARVIGPEGDAFRVTKGAPQVVMDLSHMSDDDKSRAVQSVDEFARRGYRTIGVARAPEVGSFEFLGIIPLFDPPREDSASTIREANEHGIDVKMVTGDNVAIGREISGQLGLGTKLRPAKDLFDKAGSLTDDVEAEIESMDGFAEVFPEHKYGIVKALQDKGHLVGMTGDGVNDAPALKQADVGIAVSGATGAAQAAAALVLTEPGLSVIAKAVEEARRIFARMNSYTIYRIAMTIDIMVFVVLAMISFHTYPLTAVMIVLLALLDDIPIMTIAYDNTPLDPKPVRWDMRKVLTISTVLGGLSVLETFVLLLVVRHIGLPVPALQTVVFLQLVVGGHLMLFVTRSLKGFWNRPFPSWQLLTAIFGTQIFAVFLAGLGWMVPQLSWTWIGLVWAYNLIWMLALDVVKRIVYKVLNRRRARLANR